MKYKLIFSIIAIFITASVIGSSAYYLYQSERYYSDISSNSSVQDEAFKKYDTVITEFRDFQILSKNSQNLTQEARIAKLEETIQKLNDLNDEIDVLRNSVTNGSTTKSTEYADKVREVLSARQDLIDTYIDVLSFEVCVAKVQNSVDVTYNQAIFTINSLGTEKGTAQNIKIGQDAIGLLKNSSDKMAEYKPCFDNRKYIAWANELDIVVANDTTLISQMTDYINMLISGIQEQNPEKVAQGIAGLEERDIKYPSFYQSNEFTAIYDVMWQSVQDQNNEFVNQEKELIDLYNERPGLFFWY